MMMMMMMMMIIIIIIIKAAIAVSRITRTADNMRRAGESHLEYREQMQETPIQPLAALRRESILYVCLYLKTNVYIQR